MEEDFLKNTILPLYFEKEPSVTDTLDLCREGDDFRMVYLRKTERGSSL